MRKVWRITDRKYERSAFTGEGARLFGGRWNSPGTAMIYTSESQSHAVLELLVHLDTPELLGDFVVFPIEVDESLITSLDHLTLPPNWNDDPVPASVQALGDVWAASRSSVGYLVPSVLVPSESNVLLNPNHPDFSTLKIGAPLTFQFDPRLSRKNPKTL